MSWDAKITQASFGRDHSPAVTPQVISARELQLMQFPPIAWVVNDLIPEGLSLLAGKPKLGKSWLAMDIGYAVATGGEVLGRSVEEGRVLYAALEDNNRRLAARLRKMTPHGDIWPDTFDLAVAWKRLDVGGLAMIEGWIDAHTNSKLVIIDTLATIRPASDSRSSLYQNDYEAMRGLHAIGSTRGVSIVVIHHVRKADADDPFDMVSGSTGLTGAADATLILTSSSNGKVLYGRGRDLVEFETAVDFDPSTCRWSDLGRPSDAFGSETRKAIRAALKAGNQTPIEIAAASGIEYELCAKTLQRMAESGEVRKGGRGNYRLAPDPLS